MEGVFGEMDVNDLKPRPIFEPVKEVELGVATPLQGWLHRAESRDQVQCATSSLPASALHRVRLTTEPTAAPLRPSTPKPSNTI
jgi:hypothetical protein